MDKSYVPRRVLASHRDYRELDELQRLICIAFNPCLYRGEIDMEEWQQLAAIYKLKTMQGDLMDDGAARDLARMLDDA